MLILAGPVCVLSGCAGFSTFFLFVFSLHHHLPPNHSPIRRVSSTPNHPVILSQPSTAKGVCDIDVDDGGGGVVGGLFSQFAQDLHTLTPRSQTPPFSENKWAGRVPLGPGDICIDVLASHVLHPTPVAGSQCGLRAGPGCRLTIVTGHDRPGSYPWPRC
ncbi:hypothetical protein QBC32DRAFT_95076 [Pseudoneurospora amorphoporcata]|uniref:Uncharacterized protein n=1 Tax=Pseudoneurospora amorphoporcata TaxID=241081 RepID=A0AAN6NYE0_9PEZI|nr:hypothetical protein QBC32DRAFT_95076 [Pseudoneurospora amorphoporcata]